MSAKRKPKIPLVEQLVAKVAPAPLRLDLGCGKNKKEGFIGVDQFQIPGVDACTNLAGRYWDFGKDCKLLPVHPITVTDEGLKTGTILWVLQDNSVEEANCSHFLEHLTNFNGRWERVKFFNELYRVLKPGGKCSIVLPHWASNRYYGDPTHCEPFSEMGFYYLSRAWRRESTPGVDIAFNPNGYNCDFDFMAGYTMHGALLTRNQEYQQYALANYKEAALDMFATLTKPEVERP